MSVRAPQEQTACGQVMRNIVGDGKISLCALVPYPLGSAPGQRYRIEQWAPFLKEEGINTDFLPFADSKLDGLIQKPGRIPVKSALMAAAFVRRVRHLALMGR